MTRYGSPGASAREDERPGAALFALARAWAAGAVVLLFTEYVQATVVYEHVATAARMETFGGRLLLIHLPNALCIGLAVWAAARIHRAPFRDSVPWHLTSALTVPVAAQLLNMGLQWERLSAEGLLMSNAVLAVACVAGWAADRLQEDA
ncbi:hypothetical protein [Streptomyces sp. WMMC940]|uniref:hypothetical protein n=1 Tax=Streptomyces sp. WMMC940 TaxID=3015153 RepID=UPI0022B65F80|nr:hypothetical protein [Streptomyces sp. WMMC940]MCZ7458324.1 hypothetical protein [Streptomyces sp. WMMC940]